MNDPEVTMQQPAQTPRHGLHVHDLALEAAGIVLRLAVRVPAPLKALADQAIRAATSKSHRHRRHPHTAAGTPAPDEPSRRRLARPSPDLLNHRVELLEKS